MIRSADIITDPDPAKICPVCRGPHTHRLTEIIETHYRACEMCAAYYLTPSERLSSDDEYAHYLTHENDVSDPGYRRFLSKLSDPLLVRLNGPQTGLDYGCGPGPALAAILEEAGHKMSLFDPFFVPDISMLRSAGYDFVTCTETAEHFYDPYSEFIKLADLLRPGGTLAIMTTFRTDETDFAKWYYRKDPTHVVFYHRATFENIASRLGFSFDSPVRDVAFLTRPR